ncbi:MAG: heme ABC exporter ATP-binding protein CcmA [Chloroflexi bacterium]|nr:heme ABC exporter ATP-binding protein CcmA [Chloroflexota bacterium]MCI0578353.1 heme ABC exporter ATP-binding protein CcmA [Chloroflexota bacterium]MCI0646244.1 heme ABC exporter ATP-binding protein CcmA [Chloroflexota bacterium]MCI0732136.1 heme ABC exporter ATP-binding protein CcmA [Chloroflexota bacterium]
MIKISQLTKNYGANPVLRGVELHVRPGEFVGLVGPNGAGKTTLLRIVATLLKPTAGQVHVGGWPVPQHADKVRRHIGAVSHHALLYGDLTAAENLLFYARLYQLDNAEERVAAALKTVGLAARQRDAVRSFSRGMVQRLTIARATLHEPDVLLLDEPYTGLDQDAALLLDTLLRQEAGRGRTILMITHDLARGLNLCDRIAILNRGKIAHEVEREATTPAEFLQRYTEVTRGRAQ